MNATVAVNLSLILFLPWYLVLGVLYWRYRPLPAAAGARRLDVIALLLALAAAAAGQYWGYYGASASAGAIWKQVLASLLSYGLFLAVLLAAFLWRRRRSMALSAR